MVLEGQFNLPKYRLDDGDRGGSMWPASGSAVELPPAVLAIAAGQRHRAAEAFPAAAEALGRLLLVGGIAHASPALSTSQLRSTAAASAIVGPASWAGASS